MHAANKAHLLATRASMQATNPYISYRKSVALNNYADKKDNQATRLWQKAREHINKL